MKWPPRLKQWNTSVPAAQFEGTYACHYCERSEGFARSCMAGKVV
jgi:hypothetical protein